jgi:hypothetical protein
MLSGKSLHQPNGVGLTAESCSVPSSNALVLAASIWISGAVLSKYG